MTDIEINARIKALEAQRNNAQTEVVLMTGAMAVLHEENARLKETIAKQSKELKALKPKKESDKTAKAK